MNAIADESDGQTRPRKVVATNMSYIGVPTSDQDNGRDEKPWQRLPSTYLLLLLGGYLLLGYLTQLVEDDMPSVVRDADLARDVHDTFSEESAYRYLHEILGSEPRVAGTAYHYNKTRDMKAIVDAIALEANQPVRTDWQIVSGDYFLESGSPYVNVYEQVSNVIAVLEGESGFFANGTIGSSILVNCHYDSVPFAMGASDDGVFCAVMAETLSRLSRRSRKFKHNIVFLFNGAEESGLQASHGFLQHAWARGVTTVVNLEAAGMNGKPAVFQVSDPRVLRSLARAAPRPNAQAVGQFLFASGIIPSDTDFRVFRDFGDIHGIDIAFSKWGHVYHTRYDSPDLIQAGVVQNAGNMLLGLLTEMGDLEEFATKQPEPSSAVYFDYLNVFLVTYSVAAAYAVDAAVAALALATVAYQLWLVGFRWSSVRELGFAVIGRLACVAAGVATVALCSAVVIPTTIQLRYLAEPWLVVPLYWAPYCVGAVAASLAYDKWRTKKSGYNRCLRTLQATSATRLALTIVLLVTMCVPALVYTRYVIAVPLFLMSLASLVSITAVKSFRLEAWQHLWVEVIFSLPSVMFVLSLALRLDAMMLPIMGRSQNSTPDITVAIINVGLAVLVTSTVSGVEVLFSRRRAWVPLGAVGAVCVVLMFIPFAPYQDDGPSVMRHYWFHTQVVSHNSAGAPVESSSGVVVNKMDANTRALAARHLAPAGALQDISPQRCREAVFCDLPLFRTSFARRLDESLFLSSEPPAPPGPAPAANVTRACVGELCSYRFRFTAPSYNTITIWPHEHVTLTAWSFSAPVREGFRQGGRPVYVVKQSLATHNETHQHFEFTADFIVPLSLQAAPALAVSQHAHWLQHPGSFTAAYRRLLAAVPRYYNVATFLSIRNNYVY